MLGERERASERARANSFTVSMTEFEFRMGGEAFNK